MAILTLLLTALLGCGTAPSVLDTPSADVPVRPAPRTPTAIPLARRTDLLRHVEIPKSSRPKDTPAPKAFGTVTAFKRHTARDDYEVWATALPIRSDLLPDKQHGTHSFGSSAPPDLEVYLDGRPLRFERDGKAAGSFGFDRQRLYVGVKKGAKPPTPEDLTVRFPKATADENALNHATSGLSDRDFVTRQFTLDTESHAGLYLPAPGVAEWDVPIPDDAVLTFRGTVMTPAIREYTRSDGAELVAEVIIDGAPVEVGRARLIPDVWRPERFDLSAFAGQTVRLRLRSDPGESAAWDYVFLEGPTVYTPSANPRRVVLVFVDTLRADHLPTYGYQRPTAPLLERWARHAAVFDEARNVAPWTLPSARAALSGRQPERWHDGPSVAERLADAGYHTDAIAANAFLSQPFAMQRGWTRFRYAHLLDARWVSNHAMNVLSEHPDRDVAVLVHYMDPHLPYDEPWTYRHIFAGGRPDTLKHLSRKWLVRISPEETEGFDAIRDYVIDRYDQNIRFVDDQLARLLQAAGHDATVVLFSDHGEEFWDHGEFEHGHSFHDELLRIPFIVRGKGVPASRHDAPVSLLDLTPTVLELEGLPHEVDDGTSLVPLLHGDPGAAERLAARPQAFGRPLYGDDGWSVLSDREKWVARGPAQQLWDLRSDPGEHNDISDERDLGRYPMALAEALEREVVLAWRLHLRGRATGAFNDVLVSAPGGIREGWSAYDPRGKFSGVKFDVEEGVLRIRQGAGDDLPHTVFVVPNGDPLDLSGVKVAVRGRAVVESEADIGAVQAPITERVDLLDDQGWHVAVDHAWVPLPTDGEISGFAAEMEAQLRELGYLE